MYRLHELKEKLIDELIEYADKELTPDSLKMIDTLAHAAKNLCKLIQSEEEDGYSGRMYSRRGRGRNANRDSMGRYSSEGSHSYDEGYSNAHEDIQDKLRSKISSAPDERTRRILNDLMAEFR